MRPASCFRRRPPEISWARFRMTKKCRILMFVENSYPNDPRVKNECDVLAAAGYPITVVALRRKGQPRSDVINGVNVYRVPRLELFEKVPHENPTLAQRISTKVKSVFGYASEYIYFTSACFVMSWYVAVKHGFDVIHAHNPPDTLFLVAAVHKVFGKKYIYRSRYGTGHDLVARVLQCVEWGNLKLANVTIATNESYKQIHMARGGRKADTVFVVRNGPNQNRMKVMTPSPRLRQMNKTILCYIGSLNPQDGVDYLLRSLKHLRYDVRREDFYCAIIGNGDSFEDLRKLARDLKLDGNVELTGYISDQELQEYLAAADICVDPDPSSPLNDVSTWIKVMEYMACSKPIVSFDLKETRFSAQEAAVFVPCNDELAFANAISELMDDPKRRSWMGKAGRERVEKELQWSVVSRNLLAAYESLN